MSRALTGVLSGQAYGSPSEQTMWSEMGHLRQPKTGTFFQTATLAAAMDEPIFDIAVVRPKNLPTADLGLPDGRPVMSGTGTATNANEALGRATAEAMERFCSTSCADVEIVWGSAEELGVEAVNLCAFPRCSLAEESDPLWPLEQPDRSKRIRWVRAVSLTTGALRLLPLRAVFIAQTVMAGEKLFHSISTGCAVHRAYPRAMLSAMLEVLERDALSLTWLQRRRLPHIEDAAEKLRQSSVGSVLSTSSRHIKYHFFDATTDLGVPTIYGVRRSRFNEALHTIVACATAVDPLTALRKVALELSAFAVWLGERQKIPGRVVDFNRLIHGPVYMGHRSRAAAFDFLLQSTATVCLDQVARQSPLLLRDSAAESLGKLVLHLAKRGHEAFAADLTTAEAARSGLCAVRVIIPSLMPFSYVQRARFLAHPRLYQGGENSTYTVHPEAEINPYPQPFG